MAAASSQPGFAARSQPMPVAPPAPPPPAPAPPPPAPKKEMAVPVAIPNEPESMPIEAEFADAAPTIAQSSPMRGDPTFEEAPQRLSAPEIDPELVEANTPPPEPVFKAPRPKAPVYTPPPPPDVPAGETYINDLLTNNGKSFHEAPPDELLMKKGMQRGTKITFIFLFAVIVVGIAGAGGYWWYSEKQKREQIAELQEQAKAAIADGDYNGINDSIKKLSDALDLDKSEKVTLAIAAQTAGLDSLLYGAPTDVADKTLAKASGQIEPGEPGYRELVVGRAAVELSRIGVVTAGRPATEVGKAAVGTLANTRKALEDYLGGTKDPWMSWLLARAQLAAGERKAAAGSLKTAADAGLLVAVIDQAGMLADEGKTADAVALYDKVLAKKAKHPLAVLGKALALAQTGTPGTQIIDDVNAAFADMKKLDARVRAYRSLVVGLAQWNSEEYAKATEQLKTALGNHSLTGDDVCASGPAEPRFWAAMAWAAYERGDVLGTANARNCVAWYGKNAPEDDPSVQLVDAALALAEGKPDKSLKIAEKLDGARAHALRATAYLDMGPSKAKDAQAEADELVKETTPSGADAKPAMQARILQAEAKMLAAPEKERAAAASELDSLGKEAKSKLGRHALGVAWMWFDNGKEAQPALDDALKGVTEQEPNPLAYRTHFALADVLIDAANEVAVKSPDDAKAKLAEARKHLEEGLKLDSGYDPAVFTTAKLTLREGDPDKALALLDRLLKVDPVAPNVLLVFAEILVVHKDATADDKDKAIAILKDLKAKDYKPALELGRIANLIDTKLPAELGVPVPPDAPGPPATTPPSGETPKGPPAHHH